MRKQTVQKLNLLAGGIISRLEENRDAFLGVSGHYQSGALKYPFRIIYDGTTYCLDFQKEKKQGTFSALFSGLIGQANLYDELELIYRDRIGLLILHGDDRNVTTRSEDPVTEPSLAEETRHLISPGRARSLLEALDFVTEAGKLKNTHVRKFSQAEHFIELLLPYIKKLPSNREIMVYDFACGKSYLSFFLNYYLCDVMKRHCRIIGIDIREDVVEASKKIRDTLQYRNMDFFCADILEFTPSTRIDLAISLHACDTATDYAIAAAINHDATICAIAPCCHKEFLEMIQNDTFSYLMEKGVFKKEVFRFAYRCISGEDAGG